MQATGTPENSVQVRIWGRSQVLTAELGTGLVRIHTQEVVQGLFFFALAQTDDLIHVYTQYITVAVLSSSAVSLHKLW